VLRDSSGNHLTAPTVTRMGAWVVKILVAEGNALLAEAIGDLFAEANGGNPVLTARNLNETIDVAARETPDLVVIDHRIGRDSVDNAVREVLHRSPRSAVVVMTTNPDVTMASRMRALGASCIEKETLHSRARSLVDSVRRP